MPPCSPRRPIFRSAYRTIRSEIALNIALAHYGRREYDEVERNLDGVDAAADIVYARALEYRGWVAYSRTDANRARTMFASALDALDRCRHYDRFLEANCIRALAHLAVERLDRKTWSIVETRRARIDWSASWFSAAAVLDRVLRRRLCNGRRGKFAEGGARGAACGADRTDAGLSGAGPVQARFDCPLRQRTGFAARSYRVLRRAVRRYRACGVVR